MNHTKDDCENSTNNDDDDDDDRTCPSPSYAWKPINSRSINIVESMLADGINTRQILEHLLPDARQLPTNIDDACLLHIIAQLISEPPKREKLSQYNTFTDAIELLKCSEKIIVLTGAGVSVSKCCLITK